MPVTTRDPDPPPMPAMVLVTFTPSVPIVGAAVQMAARFTLDGEPYDPAGVTMRWKAPSDKVTDVVVAREGPGVYRGTLRLGEHGPWSWRAEGEGGEGVAEGSLHVQPSSF
jgi:hypothetical protein